MPLRAVKQRRQRTRSARDGFRAVGLVSKPRGLRGEIKIQLLTDFPERFDVGATVFVNGVQRAILASQVAGAAAHLRLEGIDGRDEAEALRDALLEVPDDDRAALAEGEYYLDEIEGCTVRDEDGAEIGTVREVLQPGANDVYVVDRQDRADLLLPAIPDVVIEVRQTEQVLVVRVPPGLDTDQPPAPTDSSD